MSSSVSPSYFRNDIPLGRQTHPCGTLKAPEMKKNNVVLSKQGPESDCNYNKLLWGVEQYSTCLSVWWWRARCCSDWAQTAEAGQSGRHESSPHCTVERPTTLPESSTCFIKCFALKSQKYKYWHCKLKRALLLDSWIRREAGKQRPKHTA